MRRTTTICWLGLAWIALFWGFSAVSATTATAQVPPPLPDAIPMALSSSALSQSVNVSVQEINELAISSDVSLTIANASAGLGLDPVSSSAATYNVTTNGSNKKIIGTLDTEFAAGITLRVLLAAPGAGVATEQDLSTISVDLVTGFGRVAVTNLTITYTAVADISVPPNGAGATRMVTLTLMDN